MQDNLYSTNLSPLALRSHSVRSFCHRNNQDLIRIRFDCNKWRSFLPIVIRITSQIKSPPKPDWFDYCLENQCLQTVTCNAFLSPSKQSRLGIKIVLIYNTRMERLLLLPVDSNIHCSVSMQIQEGLILSNKIPLLCFPSRQSSRF